MRLTLVPATPDQLARVRADPRAMASALDPAADPDREALRHGPVAQLRTSWHVLHHLWAGAGTAVTSFLLAGGTPIGERARAFRSAEVAAIAPALRQIPPASLDARFDRAAMHAAGVWFYHLDDVRPTVGLPAARDRHAEVLALLAGARPGHDGLLVIRTQRKTEVTVELRLAADRAIDRYAADPDLLDAHLDRAPTPLPQGVVIGAWYPLSVALGEFGTTAAHQFVEDGGELLDEGMQLRVFDPDALAAIAAVIAAADPRAALTAAVLEREGLDPEEADELAGEWAGLQEAVGRWAAQGRGLATLLG